MGLLLIAFLIILFAALVSYLAASANKPPAVSAEGLTVMRVNRGYLIVAGAGIALVALLLILRLRRPGAPLPLFPATVGIAAGCLAVCVPVVLATVRLRVEFDREIIRHHGVFGTVKQIRWADVRQVRFSKVRLELSLFTASTKISLNLHMSGFASFLEMLKERLDPELTREVVYVIESLKRKL